LSKLEYLSVAHNDHNGNLPECPWTQLQTLDLDDNDFSGNLPKNVCDRTHMVALRAAGNLLTGSIPSCLAHWTNLEYLDVSDNALEGSLPSMLTQLTNLKEFIATNNKFTGNPTRIWNSMTQLQILYAQDNRLDGRLDGDFIQNATELIALDISENNFTSHVLPTHLLNMPKLQVLDLSLNNLKGHLPTDIKLQDTLVFFSANRNNFDGGIPSQLQNLQGLEHLDLSHNSFHGPLREEILTNLPNLMNLLLGHNPNLHAATLPSQLVQMVQLQELVLSDTQRYGPLPDLTGLTNLRILALDHNNMTSTIPTHYGTLPELQYLLLQNNPLLEGAVPDFSQATSLETILLDNTNMNTQGWEELCQLPMFKTVAEIWSEVTLTSDCDAHCDCCHCCSDNKTDCSDVTMDSLQWEWEVGARRQVPTLVDSKNV
jgi:Leucine-rich repeat (LRR) protein